LNIIDVTKAAFFLSVPFFLIGHGANVNNILGGDFCDVTAPSDVRRNGFVIARTTNFDADGKYDGLTGNGNYQFFHDGQTFMLDASSTVHRLGLADGETFRVTIDSNETEAEFSQMFLIRGLCQDDSAAIKLSAPVVSDRIGQFFEATYRVRVADLGAASSVVGPSMATYILSGGETGSELINVPSSLDVFVNSVLVYDGSDGDINNPISFVAAADDEVEVVINSLATPGTASQLWLHAPNGEGVRLSYNVELTANSEFRAIYKISSSL